MNASTVLELPTGLHPDVADAVYHQRTPGIANKSVLDLVAKAPLFAQSYFEGHAPEPTEAMRFGSAFHCSLLEPERFEREYLARPRFGDCRRKEGKAARDGWLTDHVASAEIEAVLGDAATRDAWFEANTLSAETMAKIRGMCASVRAHPAIMSSLYRGKPELTVRWKDGETGLQCKARLDLYDERDAIALDVKSTEDASAESFKKSVANFRYHVQDALYREGVDEAGATIDHFLFVAVEKSAPYAVAVYELDRPALAHGGRLARRDLRTFAECLATDVWPGYPSTVQSLELPPWAFR